MYFTNSNLSFTSKKCKDTKIYCATWFAMNITDHTVEPQILSRYALK